MVNLISKFGSGVRKKKENIPEKTPKYQDSRKTIKVIVGEVKKISRIKKMFIGYKKSEEKDCLSLEINGNKSERVSYCIYYKDNKEEHSEGKFTEIFPMKLNDLGFESIRNSLEKQRVEYLQKESWLYVPGTNPFGSKTYDYEIRVLTGSLSGKFFKANAKKIVH